jgi:UDPglucose 6-dehydrogenase
LKAVKDINKERSFRFLDRMRKVLGNFKDKNIAILGLAFKPNTDDIREAKSLEIISTLLDEGANIKAYDPVAMDNVKKIFPQITYCDNAYSATKDADLMVIVTEWNEFKLLNLERIKRIMKRPLIFDGRNIYEPNKMVELGFEYWSVGRKPVIPK